VLPVLSMKSGHKSRHLILYTEKLISGCEFLFAIRLYNCNDSHLDLSDLHSRLSGQMRFISKRFPVLIQTVCFCSSGKVAPTLLNFRNPTHFFPRAIIDCCLREPKSFLQIDCANESSFAKPIQLFEKPDA
jgi:hypothetical protein